MEANPLCRWRVSELLRFAFTEPVLFAPGTSWAFSDKRVKLDVGASRHRGTGRSRPGCVPAADIAGDGRRSAKDDDRADPARDPRPLQRRLRASLLRARG
jgi:hypothetical protein